MSQQVTQYQVHYTSGYQMLVSTSRDRARVTDSTGAVRYSGTYGQCQRWLTDRGCRRCAGR